MWAVLLQIVAIASGWQIVRQLPWTWRYGEALAASVAIGFTVVPWVYLIAALLFGWQVAMPLASAVLLGATILSQWLTRPHARFIRKPYVSRGDLRQWIVWLTVACGVLTIVSLVITSYQFPTTNGSWLSNGNVWGDGPLHVTFANQFAHGNNVDLTLHLYEKLPLRYPFMSDFWSGVLMRLTSSWIIGLMLPSLIMMLALLQLLFSFAHRLLGSARAAWLSWMMIVFSGSLNTGVALTGILFNKGLEAYNAAVGFSVSNVTGDDYLNFVYSHLLPQRSFLFAMPLLIVIMTAILELYRHQKTKKSVRWWPTAILIGILGGLLPLVHTYTFLVLVGLLVMATIGWWVTRRKLPPEWWLMLGIIALLAAPQLIWQFNSAYYGGFGHFIAGWMASNYEAATNEFWPWWWLRNIGWLFVMIIGGWYWLWQQRVKPEIWLIYVAGVAIFVVANLYVFQPTYWDNMKFFEYALWFIMLACGVVLARWSRRLPGMLVVIVIMTSLTVTGFYTLVLSGPKLTFELLSSSDVHFGNDLRRLLPHSAYVLVTDRHNSPVTMLSGANVLMSYSGWYNLYGNNWPQTLADRTTMLSGGDNAPALIKQYGLTHAVFSDDDVLDGQVKQAFYSAHYQQVTHEDGWWVYDLQKPADPST